MKNERVQKLSEQKLLQYGCNKEEMTCRCIRKLKTPDFYAIVTYERQGLCVEVCGAQLGELCTPFHVSGANDSLTSLIREEVEGLLEGIVQQCIDEDPCRTRALNYTAERYQSYPQFPWKSVPEYGTSKTAKGEWYGVIMHIPHRNLGIDVDGMTDVCNLKDRLEFIQESVDYKCFYPAYRMNKAYWFMIPLDQKLSWRQLQKLIDESHRLVSIGKQRWNQ